MSKISSFKNTGFQYFFVDSEFFKYLFSISQKNLSPKPIIFIIFWKNSIRSSTFLNIVPVVWQIFCCYQQKIWKISYFWYFQDYNSGCNHDNYINDTIFLICILSYIHWYVSFEDLQNSIPGVSTHFVLSFGL